MIYVSNLLITSDCGMNINESILFPASVRAIYCKYPYRLGDLGSYVMGTEDSSSRGRVAGAWDCPLTSS
jgi:hypothetical protein